MAETDRNIGEEVAITNREEAAKKSKTTAEHLAVASAAIEYVIDTAGEKALDTIEGYSGVKGLTLARLVDAAAAVDRVADHERAIADGLTQGADLIREHGLPS